MTEQLPPEYLAVQKTGEHSFAITPSSFVLGIKIQPNGELHSNGIFNTNDFDKLSMEDRLRFLDFSRGLILALLEHNHLFEMLGKQERIDMAKFTKDKFKPDHEFLIERLKDTNVIKVEFKKDEKEI